MVDSIGENGLVLDTASEITESLVTGMQAIYGANINTDSNSPDGQMIGLLTQMAVDIREVIESVNANFDPDQAIGALLDQRVTINNIQREGGTYTVQPISITTNATVLLQGLDNNYNSPTATAYTVQDASGNQFYLAATTTLTAGTEVCDFRAASIGDVSVPINTITTQVTIVAGVVSVNNPSSAITVGVNEESDGALRIRRQQSVANASTGYLNGLLGQILALPGVTEAALYENNTNSTDANGIPAHSIWLVVAGGVNSAIANTIYGSKSYGASMRGAVTFNITTASGGLFVAKWDVPTPENLYIRFSIQHTVTGFSFDTASIATYMANNLTYGIGAYAETSAITAAAVAGIAAQGGGGVPVLVQISTDDATWTDYVTPATIASEFTIASSNIAITVI